MTYRAPAGANNAPTENVGHQVIHKFETNTASEAREDIINEQLPGPTEEEIAMCYSSQV